MGEIDRRYHRLFTQQVFRLLYFIFLKKNNKTECSKLSKKIVYEYKTS